MSINLNPTLDIIAVRESLKHWLINRFAKTDYAMNRDPIVGRSDNVRCINDSGKLCTENDPQGLFRAIKSPGVGEGKKDSGFCNTTYCKGWCPSLIIDRGQIGAINTLPPRMILIDWIDRDLRYTGIHQVQIAITSSNIGDDPTTYKLMSLRNAFIQALEHEDPPTPKHIPIYNRSKRGHIVTLESHRTQYEMGLYPMGTEKMPRQVSAEMTRGDRSSFAQSSQLMAAFIFQFRCVMCQMVRSEGAFM
jgi:hypothetical protein